MNLLKFALIKISPAFREVIGKMLDALEEEANKTPNPYDNILVGILKTLLVIF